MVEILVAETGVWGEVLAVVIEDPQAPKWIAPKNGEDDDDYN